MRPYLFIGGPDDGLYHPAPGDAETLHWPSRIASRTMYHRLTLSIECESIVVYIHESLTPAQVLTKKPKKALRFQRWDEFDTARSNA